MNRGGKWGWKERMRKLVNRKDWKRGESQVKEGKWSEPERRISKRVESRDRDLKQRKSKRVELRRKYLNETYPDGSKPVEFKRKNKK